MFPTPAVKKTGQDGQRDYPEALDGWERRPGAGRGRRQA